MNINYGNQKIDKILDGVFSDDDLTPDEWHGLRKEWQFKKEDGYTKLSFDQWLTLLFGANTEDRLFCGHREKAFQPTLDGEGSMCEACALTVNEKAPAQGAYAVAGRWPSFSEVAVTVLIIAMWASVGVLGFTSK